MYFYMATDKGNTFENLGLRQGRDQISSSKGEIYRRKKGQGWERQSETERGFQLSGRAERRSSWTLLGCTLGKNKRQCAQQVTKEILLFKTIEKKIVTKSKHYKNNVCCEIFTSLDFQRSYGPVIIHLEPTLNGGWMRDLIGNEFVDR